ncbi:MAG: M48 family metalloprotease [Planctomycetes bacterium]|nr:M48 family metalloprotease [Planctomycetota bacterium]NUQ33323.1 M48 family metalloprotease [Planctomycetaceae bacterium]
MTIRIFFAALALTLAACQTNPITGKSEFVVYSYAEEKAMGDEAVAPILAQLGGEYPDPALKSYVEGVGRKVVSEGRRHIKKKGHDEFPDWDFQFYVVNDSLVNAFALPGGHVFVTRGILNEMKSEAELAGLLGHEASHVFLRHGARAMSTNLLVVLSVSVLAVSLPEDYQWIAAVSGVAANLYLLKYSRDNESEADEWGMEFSVKAKYEADGIINLMRTLERVSGGGGGPDFLSTHPSPGNRIVTLSGYKKEKYATATPDNGYVKGKESFDSAMVSVNKTSEAYALVDKGDKESADAASMFENGDESGAEKRYRSALGHYKRAASMLPAHGLIQRKAGETHLVLEEHKQAVEYLERARSLDGADFYEDYLYGTALMSLGRHREALKLFESSLKVAPENLMAKFRAGMCAEAMGDRQRACQYYLEVYEALPPDSDDATSLRQRIVGMGFADPAAPEPELEPAKKRKSGGGEDVERIIVKWRDRDGLYRALHGFASEHDDSHHDNHDDAPDGPAPHDGHKPVENQAVPPRKDE